MKKILKWLYNILSYYVIVKGYMRILRAEEFIDYEDIPPVYPLG